MTEFDAVDALKERVIRLETRMDGHGDRINMLEMYKSGSEAQIKNLEEQTRELFKKIDRVQWWIMGTAASVAIQLLLTLIKG